MALGALPFRRHFYKKALELLLIFLLSYFKVAIS
jgi:hypothetical protein